MKNLNDSFTLNNGVKIPCIGFGTWQTPDGDVAVESVKSAVNCGYRHIDTAAAYGNEESVGRAIKECGTAREELFITTKLWNSDQGYDSTLKAFETSMAKLGLDYLDMYLIHWPIPMGHKDDYKQLNLDTWRAFEKLYKEKRIRAIGVCNYMKHHLEPLMEKAEIKPMVNQIELHPQLPQDETLAYCAGNGILAEAWSPLIHGLAFKRPLLKDMAEKYNKTIAQICVRWCLQKGVLPLPKSVHEDRIRENADVFDFVISAEDMDTISTLQSLGRVGPHPDNIDF